MEEGSGLVQPFWSVHLDDIVRFVGSVTVEEERNYNRTTFLSIFSKQCIEELDELMMERLQDKWLCPVSFKHASVCVKMLIHFLSMRLVSKGQRVRGKLFS